MEIDSIRYIESDMKFASERPLRFKCGVMILCREGRCRISTGAREYFMEKASCLIFVTGTLIQVSEASDNAMFRILMFPPDVFLKSALPLDTGYFNHIHDFPLYRFDIASESNRKGWDGLNLMMDMAGLLFSGDRKVHREQVESNFLQNMFIWMSESVPAIQAEQTVGSRKQMLCHRFLSLVHEFCIREHSVSFYAGKLCISPHYLGEITAEYVNGCTPKQIINSQLTAEIKVRLNDPTLTVSEIAEQLNFSDYTYMSSFFRKNTGLSPRLYRQQ